MASPALIGNPAAVITVLQGFYGLAPSNSYYNASLAVANQDGARAFANEIGDRFAGLSDADLSTKVLSNMGITAETIPAASYSALYDALVVYFAANSAQRGYVVYQLGQIIAGLEGDVTFGAVAEKWNDQGNAALAYSTNPASTSHTVITSNGAGSLTLTDGIDHINGGTGNDTITAPAVQNQNGELVNSLETGDVINGGAGTDTLNATLTEQQGVGSANAPAISATLSGVEIVNYRVQAQQADDLNNNSTVDAELHAGVQQYWSDNSRGDLQIEDVRQLPEELTFGMRQTDPVDGDTNGSDFFVYFDPAQVTDGRGTAGNSSLTLTLIDNSAGANELENFPVNGIVFKLGGVQYTVQSATALGETYAEFATNLTAELKKNPALKDITVKVNDNNTITLTDPAGHVFEAVGYTWVGNVVPAGGELQWNMAVGAPVIEDAPVTTAVVLDAVGRTSQGGSLDIGSMGEGGVEVFNVSVDRDSWLTSMMSRDNFGENNNIDPKHHLETVKLTSIGAKGDLTIGAPVDPTDVNDNTGTLDGRVVNGLTDVREVLNVAFAGELKYGVVLTEDSIDRYLAGASGEVQFTYQGGDGNDNITINDSEQVSDDADFAMDVVLGAGNDRLNLRVSTANNVVVNGGTGTNTIAVASSHGTTAKNTFEGFSNFQTYEVESPIDAGGAATTHDFTSMAGVTMVNIATEDGENTELRDLAADASVLITGKNQTNGPGESNENQTFGTIAINGADATPTDTTLRVTLQNTARLNTDNTMGTLTVAALNIGNIAATATAPEDVNPIRTLEIVSAGSRETDNVITDVNAALVNTFNLSGTQDLTLSISAAANSTAASALRQSLVVNGSALTGDLDLTIAGGVVTAVDAGGTSTVTLTGTAGTADHLRLSGALDITTDTTVTGFETVHFGDNAGVGASGEVDVTNFSGVVLYDITGTDGDLTLDGMKGNERVNIDIDNAVPVAGDDLTFIAAGQSTSSVLDLEFRDSDTVQGDNDVAFGAAEIRVQDFRTISLDLGGGSTTNDAYTFDLNLLDENGNDDTGAPAAYVPDDVFARSLIVLGGGDQGALGLDDGVDTVNLGTVSNVLSSIDFSGYKGQVTLTVNNYMDADVNRNVNITLNGYGANLTEALLGANDENIVTYKFTTDAVDADTEDVTITGFAAFNDVGGVIDLTNLSVLDLSALGVEGLADLNIVQDGADINITSNDGLKFEIILVGLTLAELSNENFKFAA